MLQTLIKGITFLFLAIPASAGTIAISVVNPVSFTVPPAIGSLQNYSGSACVTISGTGSNCVSGVPPSTIQPTNTLTGAIGTASASATGPTNLSQPLVLTANGQIEMANVHSSASPALVVGEDSAYSFSVRPSESVTEYQIFPQVSIDFQPVGLLGQAQVTASQLLQTPLDEDPSNAFFVLQVNLTGRTKAAFAIDPAAGLMSLSALPGISGAIELVSTYNQFGSPAQITPLISFRFAYDSNAGGSLVTFSSNTLGLALPGVGDSPNFSVPVDAFRATLPPVGPADAQGINLFNAVGQGASLATEPIPEPSTVILLLSGSVLALRRWRRRT